jgi:nucleoside phosphorylase
MFASSVSVAIVSFNANERDAVDELLADLANGAPSPWRLAGQRSIERDFGPDLWRLEHLPLLAQGNVVAATQLAELFKGRQQPPDFVVFYGCAGAVEPDHVESVFLVKTANYASLGTVEQENGKERVTLKNKWLCHTYPPGDAEPLEVAVFPLCFGNGPINLPTRSGIPTARIIATDKVVRVGPKPLPAPALPTPPHDSYTKDEWTYGQALTLVANAGDVVLVEMESYGIGRIAQALDIQDRVVVMRVTTDALTDHRSSDASQRELLRQGRQVLGRLLVSLFTPSLSSP